MFSLRRWCFDESSLYLKQIRVEQIWADEVLCSKDNPTERCAAALGGQIWLAGSPESINGYAAYEDERCVKQCVMPKLELCLSCQTEADSRGGCVAESCTMQTCCEADLNTSCIHHRGCWGRACAS